MKVYVLESYVDYEGSTLHGVFSTPEKAMKYTEAHWKTKDYNWVKSGNDYYMEMRWETQHITETEVQ